jgi:hypothetical protein
MNCRKICFTLIIAILICFPVMVQGSYQIGPNPNDGIITISDGDAINGGIFYNNNFIHIDNVGKLDNLGNLYNDNGALLVNDGRLHNSMNLLYNDERGNLFNYGSLTNDGQVDNYGLLNNYSGGSLANNSMYFHNYGKLNNFGTLTNTNALINTGTMTNIAGGTLTNQSQLNSNNLDNYGTLLNDFGGILRNYDTLTNHSGGTLTNRATATLTNEGILDNYGALNNVGVLNNFKTRTLTNIAGGTLTNDGALQNYGTLINHGTLINQGWGAVENQGTLTSDGTITSSGAFTNYKDATVNIQGPTAVTNLASVYNYGLFKVTDSTVTFGTFNNEDTGTYDSDPAINYFQDLINYGTIIGGAGDEFHIGGNFMNYGTLNVYGADLFFGEGSHVFYLGVGGKFSFDDLILPYDAFLNLQECVGCAPFIIHVNTLHINSLAQLTGLEYISYDNVVATPEPATMLLVSLGLIGLAGIRRKVQK